MTSSLLSLLGALVCAQAPQAPAVEPPALVLGEEVLVSDQADGGALRCEPAAVLSGEVAVVAWNDSWGGRQGASIGVAVGWSLSEDGGRSFRFGGYLPERSAQRPPSGADARLAADGEGNLYLEVLSWYDDGAVLRLYFMDRSQLGTWQERPPALESDGATSIDKPGMAVTAGGDVAIALTWGKDIAIVLSRDRGRSWSKPRVLSAEGDAVRTGATVAWAGDALVAAWMEGSSRALTEIWCVRSADGGKTFAAPRRLYAMEEGALPPSGYAMGLGPMGFLGNDACVAARGAGELYVCGVEGRGAGSRVLLLRSGDGGASFGEPRAIGASSDAAPKVFPSLALLAGHPAVLYYDRRAAPGATATDVWLTWCRGERDVEVCVSGAPSDWSRAKGDPEHAMFQRNFGDYITLATDGARWLAAWTDARDGSSRIRARAGSVE